jgi:uncharacterized protein (TIGR02271 family)
MEDDHPSGETLVERDDHHGWPVMDVTGRRVGDVDVVFEDGRGQPRYLGLKAGLFGGSHTLLPVESVEIVAAEREIRTPWERGRIKAAPRFDGDEPLGADLRRAIHEHLGRPSAGVAGGGPELLRSEEELDIRTRSRSYGTARLTKSVELEDVERRIPVHADFVEMAEVEVPDPEADSGQVEMGRDGSVSVPVFEERLIVQKRLVVTKRVVLLKERRAVGEETVSDVLRRERIELEVDRLPQDAERLAGRLAGEDLSRGPTPLTRHPEGGVDDVRDTTQGPTPEIRRTIRAESPAAGAAAGEPGADSATRGDVGGTQDRLDDAAVTRHVREPDPDADLIEVREVPDAQETQNRTKDES